MRFEAIDVRIVRAIVLCGNDLGGKVKNLATEFSAEVNTI
jgi:hypothetical protein